MSTEINNREDWDFEIKPERGWMELHLDDLWRYRDLLFMFVKRDFVAVYKQTILGPLWFFVQPILTTITFTIIFGNLASMSTDDLPKPLFYLAGIVGWNYFAECLNTSSNTFIANAGIFGKVYFPRLIMPFSYVISNLLKFGIQFTVFLIMMGYYIFKGDNVNPNWAILLTPYLIFLMAGLGLGAGIVISALTSKFRDLKFLIAFGVQLLMYASPVIYPLSTVMEKHPEYTWVLLANPMTSIIETFRYAYLGAGVFSYLHLLYSTVFMLVLMFIGIIIFNRTEKTFMDTV